MITEKYTFLACWNAGRRASNSHNENVLVANTISSFVIEMVSSTWFANNKPPVLYFIK